MEDATEISNLIQSNQPNNQQSHASTENEMVSEILSRIKQSENTNVNMTQGENQQVPPMAPPTQQPLQQVRNDPIPNTTIQNTIDPAISQVGIENQNQGRQVQDLESQTKEPPSINMFEIPKDVNFSLTDLLWKELRAPIIVGLLTAMVLLPITNQLLAKYVPFIGNSFSLTTALKTFVVAILYYILTKISLV